MAGCCGQGPLRPGATAEQALMPSNGAGNKAERWLPAEGCALPALLQEQELLKAGGEP